MILTIRNIEKYLGNPASAILSEAPFRDWIFERRVENDLKNPRVDYIFEKNGLDFICDKDENIRTIFVFNDKNRFFEEGLADFPFSLTRAEVLERLGSPSKSGGLANDPILGDSGAWDRFAKSGYSIHIEYRLDSDCINKITFMRADVVP
jgi:hypothetical protein